MTKEEAIKLLRSLQTDDPEDAHWEADGILLNLLSDVGFEDVVDEFLKVRDTIGFWYS
jgi:hypothetical protein